MGLQVEAAEADLIRQGEEEVLDSCKEGGLYPDHFLEMGLRFPYREIYFTTVLFWE